VAQTVHATTITWNGQAILIMGKSGSGKSALGLQLMALGCGLVSDDRTILKSVDGQIIASAPDTIAGLIEARGVGILTADHVPSAIVKLVVDMDHLQEARLPRPEFITLSGCDLPLIWRVEGAHFPAAVLQLLKSGWSQR
jgi:HPr kinase/phosphorylase